MSTRMARGRSKCVAIAVALSLAGIVACRSNPDAAKQQYLANGDKFAAEGKYGEAIVEYRNAIKADGKSGEARFKLATGQLDDHSSLKKWKTRIARINTELRDREIAAAEAAAGRAS